MSKVCEDKKFEVEATGMCWQRWDSIIGRSAASFEASSFRHDSTVKTFLENIRKHICAFQMISVVSYIVREGGFAPTFKVKSQVYPRIGSPTATNK